VLTNSGSGALGWSAQLQPSSTTLTNLSGTGAITNLFSQTLSNATIKPLVVGVGNAAGATNTTGEIRGLEAGANVTLTPNGSNYVIAASVTGGSVSFSDLVWTNKLGTLYPVAYPTNIVLNPTNDGSTGLEVYTTNFLFQTDHYRSGGTNTLFAVFNGGRSAMVVGDQGMMLGSTNYILVPQMSIDAAYDVAFGDYQNKLISLQMYNGVAGNLCTSELDVSTNYGGLNLTANNDGTGNTLFSMRVGNDSANWEKFVASLLIQNRGGTLITPFLIDPGFHTSPTGYVFGTTYRTTNTQMIMSLQNSNFPVFAVDGVGDLRTLKKIAYKWPSSQGSAQTMLTNDGSGNLGWGTGPVLTTNGNQFLGAPLSIKDGALLTNIVVYPTGNGTAPALTVTNVPGMGTNSFQVLNTNGVPVIFALTNNGITLVASNVAFMGTQTNTSSLNILGGVTNWAAVETRGNATNAGWLAIAGGFTNIGGSLLTGSVTNGGRVDTAGGATNWIGAETKGTLYASSNLLVKAGQGTSNAWVGGRIFIDASTATTNHSGTAAYTNLFTYTVPGNTLTNTGDELEFYLSGQFKFATTTTNGFKAIYGTATIFDTGLITASNCPWAVTIRMTRTGNSSQRVESKVLWNVSGAVNSAGNGPLSCYATNMPFAQNNGITNIFVFQGESRIAAVITNDYRAITYTPGLN